MQEGFICSLFTGTYNLLAFTPQSRVLDVCLLKYKITKAVSRFVQDNDLKNRKHAAQMK